MYSIRRYRPGGLLMSFLIIGVAPAAADVFSQCPTDVDGDGFSDDPDVVCMHVAAGDGFINMANDDRRLMYMFGFHDVTGTPDAEVMMEGMLGAEFAAPTIVLREGQEFYLSLTNVGMMVRPDLFDPHTVHWHGFPNAASIFDGVPEASISINMGSTFTYYYNVIEPGTYMWHCHVEATEHMQMGMLGNLYVLPAQDGTMYEYPMGSGRMYDKFAYNDGDGSTGYDVDFPLQFHSFDPAFHDASYTVQPLPFADMEDTFAMFNGRGYPDTVNPDPLLNTADDEGFEARYSQHVPSLITATQGERILLRMSNLSVTNFYSVRALGIPMQIVGRGARLLQGPAGEHLYVDTSTVTLGGGEAADVILDTIDVEPGTYFLYTTNLNYLSNDVEDYGGMMTEIVVIAAAADGGSDGAKPGDLGALPRDGAGTRPVGGEAPSGSANQSLSGHRVGN